MLRKDNGEKCKLVRKISSFRISWIMVRQRLQSSFYERLRILTMKDCRFFNFERLLEDQSTLIEERQWYTQCQIKSYPLNTLTLGDSLIVWFHWPPTPAGQRLCCIGNGRSLYVYENTDFNLRLFIDLTPSYIDSPNFWQFI